MRVAIVSYYTPPQPAIASHRVLRMSRALLAEGHDVHWVTADAARIDPNDLDPSLGALIPDAVTVHGIDGQALITKPAAANLWEKIWRTVAWHMPRRFAWPDSFISWARQLKKRLPGLVQQHGFDVVLLCCSPHNQILVLPTLRRACQDLKIYVDYRDLLSGNPWNARGNPQIARKLLELERKMLPSADVLFVNTERAKTSFEAEVGPMPGLTVEVMRNAADYELASTIASQLQEPDLGPGIHLGFFGALYPRRRMLPVLEAIAAIPAADRPALHLHVYCDAFDSRTLLEEDLARVPADVRDQVHRHDLLGYTRALRTMQTMDALVLVNGPDESDSVFVPGKIFDYLMALRPVLFVGHEGEASAIVTRTTGGDWCFASEDVSAIAARIGELLAALRGDLEPADEFLPAAAFAPLLTRLKIDGD